MDLTLETAAADLYANPWQTFRRVTLPLLLPGIIAGTMLAFVTSLDDVVITDFVKSAGQDTLPTYMLGQIRRQISPEINAISTVLLGLTVVLLTAFFLLTRKKDYQKPKTNRETAMKKILTATALLLASTGLARPRASCSFTTGATIPAPSCWRSSRTKRASR